MPRTSEALKAQYLNVYQHKLGTIIIQAVHILRHYSTVTGSLPGEKFFCMGIPTYFQITLPSSNTSAPLEVIINFFFYEFKVVAKRDRN
jgi:hypothetical protein